MTQKLIEQLEEAGRFSDGETVHEDAMLLEAAKTIRTMAKLLGEASYLGLTFSCGTAYIRRTYIDEQEALKSRINEVCSGVGV